MLPAKKVTKPPKGGSCPLCRKNVKNVDSHMKIKHLFSLIMKRGKNLRRRE